MEALVRELPRLDPACYATTQDVELVEFKSVFKELARNPAEPAGQGTGTSPFAVENDYDYGEYSERANAATE